MKILLSCLLLLAMHYGTLSSGAAAAAACASGCYQWGRSVSSVSCPGCGYGTPVANISLSDCRSYCERVDSCHGVMYTADERGPGGICKPVTYLPYMPVDYYKTQDTFVLLDCCSPSTVATTMDPSATEGTTTEEPYGVCRKDCSTWGSPERWAFCPDCQYLSSYHTTLAQCQSNCMQGPGCLGIMFSGDLSGTGSCDLIGKRPYVVNGDAGPNDYYLSFRCCIGTTVQTTEAEGTTQDITTACSPEYLGCYSDQSPDRILPKQMYIGQLNSVALCQLLCQNFPYFGVENGLECWCGESLAKIRIDDASCSTKACPTGTGNCGGVSSIAVYSSPEDHSCQKPDPSAPLSDPLSCYQDRCSPRIFPLESTLPASNTAQLCNYLCAGHQYFGLEVGVQCWCGDSLPGEDHHELHLGFCNTTCPGDVNSFCGGADDTMLIYGVKSA